MTLDRWWAGWRHEYIDAAFAEELEPEGEGSLFERILGAEMPDEEAYVVAPGPGGLGAAERLPLQLGPPAGDAEPGGARRSTT